METQIEYTERNGGKTKMDNFGGCPFNSLYSVHIQLLTSQAFG